MHEDAELSSQEKSMLFAGGVVVGAVVAYLGYKACSRGTQLVLRKINTRRYGADMKPHDSATCDICLEEE